MSTALRTAFAALVFAPFALGASAAPPAPAPASAEGSRLFTSQVRELLATKCAACHGGKSPQAGLSLAARELALKGGAGGPAIRPGKPAESRLVAAINYQGLKMPPQGKLAQKDIDAITRWIELGAPWPAVGAAAEPKAHAGPPPVNEETKRFWAFQPVKLPAVPKVTNAKTPPRNPIDAFILTKLKGKGLAPNPLAPRAALIRRAFYDMLGLPPSPEEVEAFVNDRSPNAWEKVVDRLLASPQYGEKWGRHWLDLVRYAESNSYERDGTKGDRERPLAWRYRDYVIDSLNQDKPYDQFITEQIAGDELPQRTPERIIATGYYRLGIWDDEPVDPEQALYDDLDDIVSTTGQVFLGLTLGCARCHDHKLDPIPAKDYYRFLAFFSGLQRYGVRSYESVEAQSLRPIGTPEQLEKSKVEVAAWQAKLEAISDQVSAFEKTRILPLLTPVEKEEWRTEQYRIRIIRGKVPSQVSEQDLAEYRRLVGERTRLRMQKPAAVEKALCVTEIGRQARDTFVLLRGSAHAKGDRVQPGFLSVLGAPDPVIQPSPYDDTSGRRLALAKWLAGRENPLTARVMVNRVWGYHFGRGIVRSTSNFGFQGDRPTHPELLDWLTSRFVNDFGWKLKPLHWLILTSEAYRRSSHANPVALKKDPENDLFWRFDMRRLEAEELRDAVLSANGSLNLKMGGPSIYPDIPAEVLAGQSMPGAGWGKSSPTEQCRRSVYIFVKRSLIVPIIASFDGPETDFACPSRFATTQPTQALGMMNSAWINQQAKVFADYLKSKAGDKPESQVTLALARVLQRKPTAAEVQRGVRLIQSLQNDEKLSADAALTSFGVVALNLNEFIYLD
jgi:mono/diheme cytochrome c family protein